ncbi:MAG: outer membrane protein assembly factor BamE [Planctomycetota bacterium]
MTTATIRRLAAFAGLTAAALALSGCIYGSSSTRMSGTYIGKSTFTKIEPGETDKAWVRAVLGAPTRKTELDDGGSIWAYTYKRTERSKGTFLLIIGGSDSDETEGGTYVEFDPEGIVRDTWRD